MRNPNVSVIIVCWNSAAYLLHCLASLSAQVFRDFEVIIVDNGSKDNSTLGLEEKYPSLNLRVDFLSQTRALPPPTTSAHVWRAVTGWRYSMRMPSLNLTGWKTSYGPLETILIFRSWLPTRSRLTPLNS
jgi:glycosyltransferase involved in cell wall biosynthesis